MNLARAFSPDFVLVVESLLGKPLPPEELTKVISVLESQLHSLGYSTLLNLTESAILVKRPLKSDSQ